MNWLKNKTIIITGASAGIGKQLSKIFITKCNANVIGVGRNAEKMGKFKAELGAGADKFTYKLFDVSKEQNWKDFVSWLVNNNIKIDLLINNAGILPGFKNFLDTSVEQGKTIMDTNFYSAVYGCKYILPLLTKKGGIVNICSSDALLSVGGTNYYAASKGALKCFTASLAQEFSNHYIACFLPGFTDTDIFRDINFSGREQKLIKRFISKPEKIAHKIYKLIVRKKRYKVIGYDAHLFSLISKCFPVSGARVVSNIIKKAKLQFFDGVFTSK